MFPRFLVAAAAAFFVSSGSLAYAGPDENKSADIDAGKETCSKATGTEIRKELYFAPTQDRYIVRNTIALNEVSGWNPSGGTHGCEVFQIDEKQIEVKTDDGSSVQMPVIAGFWVRSHADCSTSNGGNIGKTISEDCTATWVEHRYTNK